MLYWLETLGCPKNRVDSEKLAGVLESRGCVRATSPGDAEVVVVNTCAFVEAAREESIETILDLSAARRPGAKLVVTGCLAERYGQELAEALPEADQVAGFGVPVHLGRKGEAAPLSGATAAGDGEGPLEPLPRLDLLNLPRPPVSAPWAYVKVAEGCDRRCGFCAIPSFRGRQRSRRPAEVIAEVEALGVEEVVLVAQDLASYGSDLGLRGAIVGLVRDLSRTVSRVRLLYLYPSGLSEGLIDAMGEAGCAYFDLSLQHASGRLLRRMRRWGDRERFLKRIESIRRRWPDAALRSSFIIGYPGETEEDHDQLLSFLEEAELDWAGFFAFSPEEGTYAASLADRVPAGVLEERLGECSELQDRITARRRLALLGSRLQVLVDAPGIARSHREAPEIDGVVRVPGNLRAGTWAEVVVTGAEGPDLEADLVARRGAPALRCQEATRDPFSQETRAADSLPAGAS